MFEPCLASPALKEPQRQKIHSDVEKFLASGGKIQQIGIIRREADELQALTPQRINENSAAERFGSPKPERASKQKPVPVLAPKENPMQPNDAIEASVNSHPAEPQDLEEVLQPKKPLAAAIKPKVCATHLALQERIANILFEEIECIQRHIRPSSERIDLVLDLIDRIKAETAKEVQVMHLGPVSDQSANPEPPPSSADAVPQYEGRTRRNPVWQARQEISDMATAKQITMRDIDSRIGLSHGMARSYLIGKYKPTAEVAAKIEAFVRSAPWTSKP